MIAESAIERYGAGLPITDRTTHMLQRFLLLWLVLSSAVAYCWPQIAGPWGQAFDPLLVPNVEAGTEGGMSPRFPLGYVVAITMFTIGGLLPRDEVQQVIRRWPMVLGGTAVQYTAMPLLAFAIGTIFQLPSQLLTGVVVVGCVPGAMASNVLTLAARGNVSYSVSLTTAATLLSPIAVPLAFLLTLSADASPDLLLTASLKLLREVVTPVVVGYLLSRTWRRFASTMKIIGSPIANLAILWIIATVVALNRERLPSTPGSVIATLLLLNIGGYAAGYAGSRLLRLPTGMQRALILEVGMQNAGVGTALAVALFADQPAATIPTAAYTFGCMMTGTILAWWFARASAEANELVEPSSEELG